MATIPREPVVIVNRLEVSSQSLEGEEDEKATKSCNPRKKVLSGICFFLIVFFGIFFASFFGSSSCSSVEGLVWDDASILTPQFALERALRGEIRILSLNMFLRPPLAADNAFDDYKTERMQDLVSTLENFDVAALQEVFAVGSGRSDVLVDRAARKGLIYATRAPCPRGNGDIVDGGLLLLSRYHLSDVRWMKFEDAVGGTADAVSSKGVLTATVEVSSNCSFVVCVTHLQADAKVVDQARNVREKQLQQLANFVMPENERKRAILTGDFNVEGGTEEYDVMRKALGVWDDWVNEALNGSFVSTSPGSVEVEEANENRQLDYVFGHGIPSGALRLESVKVEPFTVKGKKYVRLSDHFGISAKLMCADEILIP